MCLDVDLFGFILFRTLCASWIWLSVSFSRLESFQLLDLQRSFLPPFLYLLLREPYNANVTKSDVVPYISSWF